MTDPSGGAGVGGGLRGPATIGDVAQAAGVSRATVSRVVNGRTSRDTEVAARVRAAVDRLGYVASGTARSLSLGVTKTVAMVLPDLANPMFQQILRGFNGAAAADGYQVLVADSQENTGREEVLIREARRRGDAVVVCAPRMPYDALRSLLGTVHPAVVVNRVVDLADVPTVTVDYAGGIRTAAEHLLALGHRRIAYLQGPGQSASNRDRLRGLRAVERDHPELELVHVPCGSRMDDGYQAWTHLERTEADAVLAFNDIVALGLLGRLGEVGVRVPAELSVVGFDDVQYARFSHPPLTTMRIDHEQMGLEAWRQLRSRLAGEPWRELTRFVPELILRQTTGPAPASAGVPSGGGARRRPTGAGHPDDDEDLAR